MVWDSMVEEVRVLILEDVELDAELIKTQLRREGLQFVSRIVETEKEYVRELQEFKPHVILADHSLPQFDGITAMNIAQEIAPSIPFIFVSGKIGEDFAVEMLKEGATDYVLKNNLSKLPHAVKRALKESKEQMEKIAAENALKEREEKYRTLFDYFPNYVVVLDLDGRIIEINNAAASLSPYSREILIGKHFNEFDFIMGKDTHVYQEYFMRFQEDNEAIESFESTLFSQDGKLHTMEILPTPLKKDGQIFAVQVIARDITERKKAENEINASLNEKEMLLGEINSRVRNYMQMISSLLELQSAYMRDEESKSGLALRLYEGLALEDSKNRVKSMLLLHDGFSESDDFVAIDFSHYVKSLIKHIISAYKVDTKKIKVENEVDSIMLDIDAAIPCGLIVNELLTNAVKNAFPKGRNGKVSIEFRIDNQDNYFLNIQDNGIGLPNGLNFENSETMGFKLVNSLVKQLNGSVIVTRDNGTNFQIMWSASDY
jgi:PAS domain S-box-containing protein